jgi:putative DNA primase/helicase
MRIAFSSCAITRAAPSPLHHGDPIESFLELCEAYQITAEELERFTPEPTPKPTFAAYKMGDEIESVGVEYVIEPYLPRGALTMISGPTGSAKSTMGLHMAGCITTGKTFVGNIKPKKIGKVVIITGEDNLASTVVPRMHAAGCDPTKVIIVEGYNTNAKDSDGKPIIEPFTLDVAVSVIEDVLRHEEGVELVEIDPVNAFLGANIDSHMNAEVRSVITPLMRLAEKHSISILLTHHNAKDQRNKDLTQMVGGSNAWVESMRSVIMVSPLDPDKPEKCEFVMELIKSTNGKPGERFSYTTQSHVIKGKNGRQIDTSKVVMGGPSETSIAQIMNRKRGGDGSKKANCADWLMERLEKGPVLQTTIKAEAKELGYSESTLDRAKKKARVRSVKPKFDQPWVWTLNQTDRPETVREETTEDDTEGWR